MNESRNARTALVLGGGGSTGNAWLIGVVAGLHEAGLDVTNADLIIGTSAGSTAAAQLTSAGTAELLAVPLAPVEQRVRPVGSDAPRPSPVADQLDRMKPDHRRGVGRLRSAPPPLRRRARARRRVGPRVDEPLAIDRRAATTRS